MAGLPFIASAALQTAGSIFEGISNYNASMYSSRMADKAAAQKMEEEKYNEEMQRRQYARLKSKNITAAGASGLTIDSFSDVLHDSDLEFEKDVLSQKYNTAKKISALHSKSRMDKKSAKNAIWSSLLGAGTSALKGVDGYNDLYGEE